MLLTDFTVTVKLTKKLLNHGFLELTTKLLNKGFLELTTKLLNQGFLVFRLKSPLTKVLRLQNICIKMITDMLCLS